MPYNKEDITRYVDNELTALEKEQFEAEMLANPSLAAEVSLYKEVSATLQERLPEDELVNELRATLQNLNSQHFAREKVRVVPFRKYSVAIAVAAAAILFIVMLWPSGTYTDKYGSIEMMTSTERGENKDSLLQQASVYFNKKQFKEALPLLDAAVQQDSASQMALFYRGVARQFTGSLGGSRKDLERVFNGESIFQYEAAFYIALGYAKEKNSKMAEEWLKRIPAGTNASDRAAQLLKKL